MSWIGRTGFGWGRGGVMRARRASLRIGIVGAVTLSLLAATAVVPEVAWARDALPSDSERLAQSEANAPDRETTPLIGSTDVEQDPAAAQARVVAASADPASWPEESTTVVDPAAGVAEAASPDEVVRVESVPADPAGTDVPEAGAVEIRVADRPTAEAAGVDGIVMEVVPQDAEATAPVELTVDYSTFGDAYGGDWSARLRMVELPACALDTPDDPDCREQTEVESVNDPDSTTVTATVAPQAQARVLAVTAASSGSTGNWSATSLSPSAAWQVSEQTGDFSWSYPLRTPPANGGPAPSLALSYSSGSIDGKVASTNNQTSWVGDGWDLGTGFVERSYVPCSQDMAGGNNASRKTGDLCWSTDNATLVLNGSANQLVRDAATGVWRLTADDGTRVERLTGGSSADNDGEYWKVTTTDGTQYVFGRERRSATDSTPTNATWTVPVFGNQPGEPCYAASFASSWCTQAWRWNLEYVVDTSGNSLTYFYAKETNQYGRNLNTAVSTYDRGGYLTRIDYGQRAGSETASSAPQRVEFTVAERCLPSGSITCDPAQLTASTASSWPDVPVDLICTSTTSCPTATSPAFFTRKRLVQVDTSVLAGQAYRKVDSWTLTQTYPDPGDGTGASLWLAKIGHSGVAGTTITLPDVVFHGVQMPNRVDTLGDYGPPMNHYRISSIDTEAGATISVNYTPTDCSSADLPASPDTNTRRCFPVMWTPEGSFAAPVQEYFHKYLVTSVVADGKDGLSVPTETHYSYIDGAAWHYDDNPLVPVAQRTWGQFRGYGTVDVITGSQTADQRSWTRYRYFRGMDGDHLAGGGARAVSVDGIADQERLNGFLREQITYDGVGGAEVAGTLSSPWVSPPTATGSDGRSATYAGIAVSETRTTAPALPGGRRTTRTVTTYDPAFGSVVQVDDQGDVATGTDDLCTRTEYVRNLGANIVSTVSRVETVAVACATSPTRPVQVVSDVRISYDGSAYGVAPTRGLVTTHQTLAAYSGTAPTYVTDATTAYDASGRVVSASDALGRTTTTAYTPSVGGPVTTTTVTSPDPDGTGPSTAQATVTENDPAWGVPVRSTDPNGKVTTATYDALGRLTAVWLPGRAQGSKTASTTYAYTVSATAPDAITTSTITAAETYKTSVQLYDGLLRPRQTQAPSVARDTAGRVVTDTVYDSRGLVAFENGSWFTAGTPSTTFVSPTEAVPSRVRHVYDGAGRETATITDIGEHERWRTTTTYGGDRVSTDPPAGGVAETVITDARGRTVERRQYTGGSPSVAYQATTSTYTAAGLLSAVNDAAGNSWSYTYDLRGRQTVSVDPDKGRTTSAYDDAGQLLTTTDARGVTLAYTYDALGRRTSTRDGSVTGTVRASWTYDTVAKGQLTSSTRYSGTNAYVSTITGYDDGYRPLGQSITLPANEGALAGTYTTGYTYTADGQQATVKLPAAGGLTAETVTTHYDSANLPETMNGSLGWGVYVAGTLYSSYGQLLQTDLGNTYSNYISYDYEYGTNRLTHTWLTREGITGNDVDLRYTYDDAGNTTKVADQPTTAGSQTDTQCYAYDGLNRLTTAWTPGSGDCASAPSASALGGPAPYWTDYAVDSVGNRLGVTQHTATSTTTSTYAYPSAGSAQPHAVQSVTSTGASGTSTSTYGYDAIGNTTSRAVAGKAAQSLTWDAEGRLATVTEGGSTSSYLYTADGSRLVRRQGGSTTVYLPGGQELTLTASTSTVTAVRYYSFGGQTVAVRTGKAGSTVSSLMSDPHQTATVSIANTTKVVTQRRLDPYGNERGSTSGWVGDHGFLDKPTDTTGLTSIGARYYDATLGRFVSVDPVMLMASPQQWAAYSYGNNNPLTYCDPSGLAPLIDGKWGSPRAAKASRRAANIAAASQPMNIGSPFLTPQEVQESIGKGLISWGVGAANFTVSAPVNIGVDYWNSWQAGRGSKGHVLSHWQPFKNPYASEGSYDISYGIGEAVGPQILIGASAGGAGAAGRSVAALDDMALDAANGARVVDGSAAAINAASKFPKLTVTRLQLEKKFLHARDFGVTQGRGAAGFDAFGDAVTAFVDSSSTTRIAGTYRGDAVILNYDTTSSLVVVQQTDGAFVSGWKLNPEQLANVIDRGSLGGG